MQKFLPIVVFLSLLVNWVSANAEIHSQIVNYQVDGQPFQGYLSYDASIAGKRPAVLVVHEWWGHNAYARKRADMLTKLGYTAFALDMYGRGKVADHPDDARKFMQATLASWPTAEKRFNHALQLLRQQSTVDGNKIAAIGYCFGGGIVLNMARSGADLLGVVSFHGSLAPSTAIHDQIKTRILVLNGANDPFVTREQIVTFKQDMQQAGAQFEFIDYPGVIHGFTNPDADSVAKRFDMAVAYNAEADKDSWKRMQTFFKEIFDRQ